MRAPSEYYCGDTSRNRTRVRRRRNEKKIWRERRWFADLLKVCEAFSTRALTDVGVGSMGHVPTRGQIGAKLGRYFVKRWEG